MKNPFFIILIATIIIVTGAWNWPWQAKDDSSSTVPFVNISLFSGHWYEIARLPYQPELNCVCSQQFLEVQDNSIFVNNTCHTGSPNGPLVIETMYLKPENETFSRLKIQKWKWVPFFRKDYYIFELADDYSWALVGNPNREHLWIISRKPQLDLKTFKKLEAKAKSLGFPVDQLIYEEQVCGNNYEVHKTEKINKIPIDLGLSNKNRSNITNGFTKNDSNL